MEYGNSGKRAFIVLALGLSHAAAAGWRFDWSEEFNRTGSPELAGTWKLDGGGSMVRNAKFDPADAFCDGGKLVIEARRVGATNEYTSAGISTVGLKSWQYGRFEMRARIDIRSGSWPAWWTTAVSGIWPGGGEIDMMEYYGDKVLFNVMDGKWTSITLSANALGGAAWAAQFHTWVMEWDSTRIDLSIDGRLVTHYPIPGPANPFYGKPQNMRLNQAIGQNGGDPSKTQFPMRLEVDYVRHWEWASTQAHTVAVEGGTGAGDYVPGTEVSITAKMAPPGQTFDRWIIRSGQAVFAASGDAATTFLMPTGDVSIAATYKQAGTTGLLSTAGYGSWGVHLPTAATYDLAGRKYVGFKSAQGISAVWPGDAGVLAFGTRLYRTGDASEAALIPLRSR